MKNIESTFKAIDKDGSGDLDHGEFTTAMNRLGLGLSEEQIDQCIEVRSLFLSPSHVSMFVILSARVSTIFVFRCWIRTATARFR